MTAVKTRERERQREKEKERDRERQQTAQELLKLRTSRVCQRERESDACVSHECVEN